MAFSASSQKIEAKPVFHNVGGPLRVPGFGYAVEYEAKQHIFHRFYHGVNDFRNKRLLVRELAMLAVMDALTEKPRWHEKMFDEAIVEKWWIEATAMPLISPLAWDWCLRELKDKAQYLAEHGFIKTLETGSVCAKSDNLIDADLRGELLAGVRPLLDVKVKDWHPNSNEQVLNLVHPSLFPLVYGRTQVLHEGLVGLFDCVESCGKGSVAPQYYTEPVANQWGDIMSYEEERTRFSRRFQWLPAEVKFNGAAGTTDVEFTSYINNLHPVQHKKLYSTIAKVVSKAVPMWNEVLVKGYHGRVPPRVRTWVCQGTKSTYNRTHTDLIRSKSFSTIISHLIATQKTKYGIEIVARMPNDCLTKVFREAETQPFKEPAWLDEMPRNEPYGHSSRDSTLLAKVDEFLALPDHPGYSSAGDWDYDRAFIDGRWKNDLSIHMYEAVNWKLVRLRGVLHPEPGDAYTYDEWKAGKSTKVHQKDPYNRMVANLKHEYPKINLETEFRDQGLQVIVKLASVELTPEKPEYDGGSWRLEGMKNEHIVATAIYYYSVENVTESLLDFRMEAELDPCELQYDDDDYEPLARIFGASSFHQEPAVQNLGSLQCKEGRLLAFPNTLQRRVQPFKLEDPTRTGHLRFLVLWLVDPNYRIVSTANVPPQQHDWFAAGTLDRILARRDLAAELEVMIREHVDGYPMSLDTAKELRLVLMQERAKLMPSVEKGFDQCNFS